MIQLVSKGFRKNLNVFIASPSDVNAEREAAHNVVQSVNDVIAHRLGFTLTCKMWEKLRPTYLTADQWMEQQLQDCDFFLMILWRRFGTPPSETSSCGSGTIQ